MCKHGGQQEPPEQKPVKTTGNQSPGFLPLVNAAGGSEPSPEGRLSSDWDTGNSD